MQKVKFGVDFDLDCLGQNAGVNRQPANHLMLENNVLFIRETKQSYLMSCKETFKNHNLITRIK